MEIGLDCLPMDLCNDYTCEVMELMPQMPLLNANVVEFEDFATRTNLLQRYWTGVE
jgi:hypothetical protein